MSLVLIPDPPAGLTVLMPASGGHTSPPDGLDRHWFLAVNGFARRTPLLHPIMTAYATYAIVVFAVLLLFGWQIARRDGRPDVMGTALWAPLGALAAVAINQVIVGHVAEPRAYSGLGHILMLTHRSNDFSLPSDHAVMAGAVAAGLWLLNRRLGLIATGAGLVMAFARVYIGTHDPGDVAAGLILGANITLAGYALQDPGLTRIVTRLGAAPLRPLLTTSPPAGAVAIPDTGSGGPGQAGQTDRTGQCGGRPARLVRSPSALGPEHRSRNGDVYDDAE
jgi:membrane-associated phospholipid phosphatase